jgi:hypothetical protein
MMAGAAHPMHFCMDSDWLKVCSYYVFVIHEHHNHFLNFAYHACRVNLCCFDPLSFRAYRSELRQAASVHTCDVAGFYKRLVRVERRVDLLHGKILANVSWFSASKLKYRRSRKIVLLLA